MESENCKESKGIGMVSDSIVKFVCDDNELKVYQIDGVDGGKTQVDVLKITYLSDVLRLERVLSCRKKEEGEEVDGFD